jgi:DNA-binding transcriptional LysR family regulator
VRICVVIPNALNPHKKQLDWQTIAALPWIWVDNNFPFYKALQHSLLDQRTIPNQAVTAVDEQIVRELVAAGQGVAIMREDEARLLVKNKRATIWNRGWSEIPLCLGWQNGRGEEKSVRTAKDVIQYVWSKPVSEEDGSMTDKCWV